MKSIDIAASKGLSIGGVDIITDSSGTTTLKNIDALDATTEATIEAAVDTLASLTTAAGLTSIGAAGATTNIAAGDLTMYNAVNNGNPTISLGSSVLERLEIKAQYESGAQGLDGAIFTTYTAGSSTNDGRFTFFVDEVGTFQIRDHGINLYPGKSLQINSVDIITDDGSGTATLANIDALDDATESTIEGAIDALGRVNFTGIVQDGDQSATPGDGVAIHVDAADITDNNTSASGTATKYTHVNIENPRLLAAEGSVTTTSAATLYIKDAPTAGTNQTITRAMALWVDAGNVKFDGDLTVDGTITGDLTGNVTGNTSGTAATVTGGTQSSPTTCANLTTVGTIGTGVWQGTAIASAYLDADTAHYSATRQVTHHMIQDDIDSDVVYISLMESDAENTSHSNKHLPLIAPGNGKLLKIFLRTTVNYSSETFTWKLYTRALGATTGGAAAQIGAKAVTGPDTDEMATCDFTTGVTGTNAINAGDKVQISIEAGDGATANGSYFITCLWEWDLS
jgi:hypothetical protein